MFIAYMCASNTIHSSSLTSITPLLAYLAMPFIIQLTFSVSVGQLMNQVTCSNERPSSLLVVALEAYKSTRLVVVSHQLVTLKSFFSSSNV